MFKTGKDGLLKLLAALGELLSRLLQRASGGVTTPVALPKYSTGHRAAAESVAPRVEGTASEAGESKGEQGFESEVQRFLQWCHANVGALYVWPTKENKYSGKGLPGALYENVFDCSGYVTSAIYFATKGKTDLRATHSAQRLWDSLVPHGGHGPCLAFYGLSNSAISHVVAVLPDGRCVGSSRGSASCTNPAIALERNSRVVYHQSAQYRADLRGFRALPLKESTNG